MLLPRALILLALTASPTLAASGAAHYQACMAQSSSAPAAALADADAWVKSGGGVPAQHCAALALVTLKRYAEAAARLDQAASGKQALEVQFRIALYDQAGNAWLLAGDGARAVQSLSAALALSAGDADLFADLARAQAMLKNWHEVDLDLNAALNLNPRRADLLVLRASARRALKNYAGAGTDLASALKLRPGDGDALVERGLLRKQLGDLGGARRDFEAALKSGASASTAAQAKDNLALLAP